MKLYTMAALAVATLPLAACLGSEDNELPDNYEEVSSLYEAVQNEELEVASEELMSGTATLSGAIAIADLGEDEDLEAIGALTLTANFTTDKVTGTADSFALYEYDTSEVEASLTGSLDIEGDISGTSMTADLEGTLTDDEDHDVALTMDGTFYDSDGALAVVGDIEGMIDDDSVEGGFAAIE
ncbi:MULTISPECIES: hypothetical protein [Pacificibacter]|uniref:hypothetical protein n=1 Tax=Pacificibacter TaxID=1042323 RepID=UPI001C08BBD0|nr:MULTISPECIES: hypothetical protein [Pacificibacter]MBU2935533.1 hypothetical protein [Pacificibacter marinus]MDO6614030.1 hypothetical protein [Pacificibacter sp. 1_MG-2023]